MAFAPPLTHNEEATGGTTYVPSASPYATPTVGTASAPTPEAPGPAPAPHIQTSPGYTPDWSGLITTDPAYLSAKANAVQAQGDAAARRKAALQSAVTRYGGLPTGFTDQYGDIDQATVDQASKNPYSVLANLAKNYSQTQEQFKRGLAARGALQSGDLNYGLDQLDQSYGQQRYDAANTVGGDVNNALNSYMSVLQGNAGSLSSALQGAEASVAANPGYKPTPAKAANYDAGNSATYGQPIYVDDTGSLFDMNGNPFTPPGPAPTPTPDAAPAAAPASPDAYFNPTTGASQAYAPARGLGMWAS